MSTEFKHIRNIVDKNVHIMFAEAQAMNGVKDGHIYPEQAIRLDKIIDDLTNIIQEQIIDNL